MPHTDLFDTTRHFLDPDFIHRVSEEFDEPEKKVEESLRVVIPTVLSEVISRGSTDEGSRALVKSAHAEAIFGDHYGRMAQDLTNQTGMPTPTIEKLMDLITPVVFDVIDSKVRSEDMTARDLSNYLQEQKKVLKGFKPPPKSEHSFNGRKKTSSWFIAGLVSAGILVSLWTISNITRPVFSLRRSLATIYPSSPQQTEGMALTDVPAFLRIATRADFPAIFSSRTSFFAFGTTNMRNDADAELDAVASGLKTHPRVLAVIGGYIEDSGDKEENLLLSENRAMLVREELIGRGVEPSRLRADGKGLTSGGVQIKLTLDLIK